MFLGWRTCERTRRRKQRVFLLSLEFVVFLCLTDKIVVLSNEDKRGSHVVEVGTHEELMKIPDGVYRHLVNVAEGKR